VHEVGQRAERLFDVGVRTGAMDLVKVDPIGAQAAQGGFDGAHYPPARVAAFVGILAHRVVELGGQDDVVAPPAGERLAHDLLGLAPRVDIGGVYEIDPGVERAVDGAEGFVMVRVAPGPEHHGPQAQLAD